MVAGTVNNLHKHWTRVADFQSPDSPEGHYTIDL